MRVIIDRFEGHLAVCEKEDRTMIDIKRVDIPTGVKEGNVFNITNDGITIDLEATEKRKKQIEELTKGLWN